MAGLYLFLTNNNFGRFILVCLISALVVLIETLVFAQNAQLFFRVVGVELLAALAIGWVVYMLSGRQQA